ncbi:MAG TPA: hypothetical protein VFK69_00305 [Candidatus Eisenbacteria bacterium]|nr:hypothetical protein [Candidatus Eisenbacteria bacterium]
MRRALVVLAMVAALVPGAPGPARAADRLDYRGRVLGAREVEALVAPALRAPGDSAALARSLLAVERRLEDDGWLDARVAATRDSAHALHVAAREGDRYRWGHVLVIAPDAGDSARLVQALALAPGGWASPSVLAGRIAAAVHTLADHGHPYARLAISQWQPDSGRVTLTLEGSTGPLVTVSRTRIEGLVVTRPAVAERALGRLAGAPYDRAAAEAARDRLEQLGLFRSVTFVGLQGDPDWTRGRLLYRVEEPHYNRFEGAVGVQGAAGVVGLADLGLGNLLGTGRAGSLHWESRGHGVVNFEARYAEPMLFGRPLRLEGVVSQQVQDTLFTRSSWSARARWSLPGDESVQGGYEQQRVVQATGALERADIQNTEFTFERVAYDRLDAPRHGSRLRLTGTQRFERDVLRAPGSATSRASAVDVGVEGVAPFRSATLSLALRMAGWFGSQRVLPLYQRWPLGGAATLRGYDEEAFRVDRFALSRFEWGWYLGAGAERAFLFWDHAWMATRLPLESGGDRLQSLNQDGLGVGLTLPAAGGLVGLDYGLAPGRGFLEGKIHLQLVSTF